MFVQQSEFFFAPQPTFVISTIDLIEPLTSKLYPSDEAGFRLR